MRRVRTTRLRYRLRRAADGRGRPQLIQQALELHDDGLAVQLVFHEPLDAIASDHTGLFKKGQVAGHDRSILNQVAGDILHVGAAMLKKDQHDLLPHRFGNRSEKVCIQGLGQRRDRTCTFLGVPIVAAGASALYGRSHVVPRSLPVWRFVLGRANDNGSQPCKNLHGVVLLGPFSKRYDLRHPGAPTRQSPGQHALIRAQNCHSLVAVPQHETDLVRGRAMTPGQLTTPSLASHGGNA